MQASEELWAAASVTVKVKLAPGLNCARVATPTMPAANVSADATRANATGPAVALGYAIGRIGCQLAGDGDYGKVSGLPWAMGYPHGTVPTPPGVRVQPTPIYEVIVMSFVVWILWRLATRYDKSGWWTFGWFLILSAVERFAVEFVRRNPVWFAGLTQPQWGAIASAVIGAGLVVALRKRPAARVA